jgi:hypothetical protein
MFEHVLILITPSGEFIDGKAKRGFVPGAEQTL